MFHPQLLIFFSLSFLLILSIKIIEGIFPSHNSPVHVDINKYHVETPSYPLSAVKFTIFVSPFSHVNVIATIAIIIITLLNIIVYKLLSLDERNTEKKPSTQTSFGSEHSLPRFSLPSIVCATNNFDDSNVIGRGGFGKVYKGIIDDGAIPVAIKRLNRTSKQGANEFLNEITMLSKFRHRNLISLIGYCDDSDEMILIYEYMENGALADHLYKSNINVVLSWVQRLKICIEAARGLEYLHTGTNVIHRDMKSSNILLDGNFTAKVSDFGISKVDPTDLSCSHVSTKIKGTRGYVDPEYLLTHKLTKKSDVYSFGVVLFEVLSGRAAVDLARPEEQRGLVFWAQHCINEEKLDKITDPCLICQMFPNSLAAFVKIANQCLHFRSKKRPTMAEVVASLESALALQERTDSSILDHDWSIMGANFSNQEILDYSLEHVDVIQSGNKVETIDRMKEEIVDYSSLKQSGDGQHNYRMSAEKRIGNSNTKTARMTAFINRVRKGFTYSKEKSKKSLIFHLNTTQEVLTNFAGQDDRTTLLTDFSVIRVATNNFSDANKLGYDAFGPVFKGSLLNGEKIIVKRLSRGSFQGELEFKNEVSLLVRLQHRNLVRLLGFCLEGTERLIVYEFVPYASLHQVLFRKGPAKRASLGWDIRTKIVRGIARALLYLHEDSRLRIVHRDLHAGNVLLDAELNPIVSNFGLAMLFATNETQRKTRIAGTSGFAAPEYIRDGLVSVKTDVFSFGVLILQIVSGRKYYHFQNDMKDLLSYAWTLWTARKASELIDPLLVDKPSISEVVKCVQVGLLCVQEKPEDRPEMSSVLLMLDSVDSMLPQPNEPAFFAGRTANATEYERTSTENELTDSLVAGR